MPSSEFKCPRCETRFRVDDQFLGRLAACPRKDCRQKMRLAAREDDVSDSEAFAPDESIQELPQQAPSAAPTPTAAAMPDSDCGESPASPDTADEDSSVLNPAGSRISRTEQLARRNEIARRVQAVKPAGNGINPAWYGVALGLMIGVGGVFAWTRLSELDKPSAETTGANAPVESADDAAPILVEGVEHVIGAEETENDGS